MCTRIDQQTLSDILDGEVGFVSNIELVEALRDDFVQVFVEQLSGSCQSVLERKVNDCIALKKVLDPACLVIAEFLFKLRFKHLE